MVVSRPLVERMLDSLDCRIVAVLQKDARIALVKVAKELGVSRGVVQTHYSRLRKSGVIKGATLVLNMAKMGVSFITSIAIEANSSDLDEVNTYVKELKIEDSQIFSWITFGRYNIVTLIFSRNLLESYKITRLIRQHPSVLQISISLSGMSSKEPVSQAVVKRKLSSQEICLDEIDLQIIRILCKDARIPFSRIGKMLNIATETVFKRFKRLRKRGILFGSTIVLNSKKCGLNGRCGLYVKLKSGSSFSFIKEKLTEYPIVEHSVPGEYDYYVDLYYRDLTKTKYPIIAHSIYGEYDYYIDFYYGNFQEMYDLIGSLRKFNGIVAVEPIIYVSQEWSIPFLLQFEDSPPMWAFRAQNQG